ncbi:hypothetical protein ACFRQM_18665 [Streptomyces sp. NPDC056831]|uniref:hypothetical protein n=1 Tax=Streptomyces sp. NPDC056831 TaxID=3345954 RepID=UPI0036A33B94
MGREPGGDVVHHGGEGLCLGEAGGHALRERDVPSGTHEALGGGGESATGVLCLDYPGVSRRVPGRWADLDQGLQVEGEMWERGRVSETTTETLQYRFDGPEDAPVLVLGPYLGTTWHRL